MPEFLKWLSENPRVLTLVLSLVVLSWVVLIVAFFWALKTGGEANLWLINFKARTRIVGISEKLKIEVGAVEMPPGPEHEAFYKNVQNRKRTCRVPIQYANPPFKKKPQIFLALSKIDVGGSSPAPTQDPTALVVGTTPINRLLVRTDDEHIDGFTLVFETWDDSVVYNASASWIAVGEE